MIGWSVFGFFVNNLVSTNELFPSISVADTLLWLEILLIDFWGLYQGDSVYGFNNLTSFARGSWLSRKSNWHPLCDRIRCHCSLFNNVCWGNRVPRSFSEEIGFAGVNWVGLGKMDIVHCRKTVDQELTNQYIVVNITISRRIVQNIWSVSKPVNEAFAKFVHFFYSTHFTPNVPILPPS